MYRLRQTTYRCTDCKHVFAKVIKFLALKYPEGTDLPLPKKDPDCPKCKKANKVNFKSSVTDKTHDLSADSRVKEMNDSRKPPNMGNMSNAGKAFDATAEIVMQDYGMTDINMNPNMRAGDNAVPKLAPHLEQQVDKVFAPQKSNVMGAQAASLNKALTNSINAGAYKNYGDVVARQQSNGYKVPVNIIHEHREKPN